MRSRVQLLEHMARRCTARLFAAHARRWPPRSRILIARDYAGWTLDIEALAVQSICRNLGLRTVDGSWMAVSDDQAVFHVDQFVLLNPPDWKRHRVGLAYYHGLPDTPGHPEFNLLFEQFRRLHQRLDAVQVSHRAMRDFLANSGVAEEKLHLIPIGFHAEWFRPPSPDDRKKVRQWLGFPESAFVVGSFQKDGSGWGEGLEPKYIKGPDVLVAALKALRLQIPELHVLLTGPARGFVKRELTAAGIPWQHRIVRRYRQTVLMYYALDAYLIASRQEGGPKAVLESMATATPVISTKVGQASDLIVHGLNGFLVEVGDADGLAYWTGRVARDSELRARLVENGIRTAALNSYDAQLPLWRNLFDSLIAK
ncbi:MAG: glycosyltransferase [Kiritimatiellae bacterium]|nr:glycosyltransferase [Kiritimatiellia bacterium]MDW8458677.1 glycosyltransferase [Verrucomicrobiota bacterium]